MGDVVLLGVRDTLWFDTTTWLVWIMPFLGVLAAVASRRRNPFIENGRVLRHDGPAMLSHWLHGVGTVILLVSGIALGLLFIPALVGAEEPTWRMMNAHYIGVLAFLFGTFYYGANTLLSGRLKEHLPHSLKGSLQDAVAHYRAVFTKSEFPGEGKYFASEHLSYPMAAIGSLLMVVTGLFKVAAHSVNLPEWLMGAMTVTHDVVTVVMALFLVAHVIMGALVPWSWPLLRSMFTGYVSEDYVKHHHAGWYRQLTAKKGEPDSPARPEE